MSFSFAAATEASVWGLAPSSYAEMVPLDAQLVVHKEKVVCKSRCHEMNTGKIVLGNIEIDKDTECDTCDPRFEQDA